MIPILEIAIVIFITVLFIKFKNPKIRYLFFGYIGFMVALVLQFPFRYLEILLKENFGYLFIPALTMPFLAIIISELTKYFSLKTFMKTKSYKNGILFGIGWVSLESITNFSIIIYSYLFTLLSLNIEPMIFAGNSLNFINFVFFFVFNLSVSVLIIISIIKRNYFFLIYGIGYSLLVYLGLSTLSGIESLSFSVAVFAYSLYLIFKYNKIK